MKRLVLLCIAVLALAALPGTARAAEVGIVLGEQVFGPLPCGAPSLERIEFIGVDTLAGADTDACQILLNATYAPQMTAAMRCTLVLHEYGHLAGHEHSDRRDSVMFAEYQHDDPRCTRAVQPFSISSRAARAVTRKAHRAAQHRRVVRPSRR